MNPSTDGWDLDRICYRTIIFHIPIWNIYLTKGVWSEPKSHHCPAFPHVMHQFLTKSGPNAQKLVNLVGGGCLMHKKWLNRTCEIENISQEKENFSDF